MRGWAMAEGQAASQATPHRGKKPEAEQEGYTELAHRQEDRIRGEQILGGSSQTSV